jgi:diguanylate cyclase (GGDEF)-like protein
VAIGLAFVAHAVLWSVYAIAFWSRDVAGHPLAILITYNAYVDTVLQTLLAYGIVLVVTEEATLETKRAHVELEAVHDALRHAAFRDQMSGVMNRHAFDEGVGLEKIGGQRGAVAVLDVDHLKPLNDSLGHAAGDTLLRHVATTLIGTLEPSDALYRWGGDEFLLVFAGCDRERARNRLDAALSASPTLSISGMVIPVRASFGCAEFASGADLLDAIAAADRAMYAAKSARRVGRETPVMGVPALRIDAPVARRAL